METKVLLVDGDPEVLAWMQDLVGARYPVETADCGEIALEKVSSCGPFAVVITDFSLPSMSGAELLQRLREVAPDTVPIMMTGDVDIDVAIQGIHRGRIWRFLEKPCPQEDVEHSVDTAVQEHSRRLLARTHTYVLEFSRDVLSDFNAQLSRRIQEQTAALRQLHTFVCSLSSADTLDEIVHLTAAAAHQVSDGRAAVVRLWGPGGEGEISARLGGASSLQQYACDVSAHGDTVGSISVDQQDPRGRLISSVVRDLLSSVASSAATAVHNLTRREERNRAQHATILALAKLAEQRDNETGKHLERVSLYCRVVAEALRDAGHHAQLITDDWIDDLARSAPLHDIGKVGIPDAILLKPGKLTADEWEIMKRHTEIGADTLRSVITDNSQQQFLQLSLEIAWCHHEKWDGSGYPRGLHSEEIPLSARILMLADVYDALTTRRPYKRPWEHSAAVEWICSHSGTHFDPAVVEAFVASQQQADFVRMRLADDPDEVVAQERQRRAV